MSSESIKIQVLPSNISFVNWIIEGYEHIGVVSTLDREKGLVIIRSTEDMLPELRKIIESFIFPVHVIDE